MSSSAFHYSSFIPTRLYAFIADLDLDASGNSNPRDGGDPLDVPSTESSPHEVSKLEASLYYFGIRGHRKLGPKLIYRNSDDKYVPPSGPEHDPRVMKVLPVNEHRKLGKDDLWATIRSGVRGLLGTHHSTD